jgi:hypothetical protein
MSDDAPGFSIREDLLDLIFQIESDEVPAGHRDAKHVVDEAARLDPVFAAERRQSRRRLKAWKRERDRLADDVSRRQIPFVVLALNDGSEELTDAACDVVRISDFLFEADAPIGLIMDLFRLAERLLPDAEDKPA